MATTSDPFELRPYQRELIQRLRATGERQTGFMPFGHAYGNSIIYSGQPPARKGKSMMLVPKGMGKGSVYSSAPPDYLVPPRRALLYYHVQHALQNW